MDIRVFLKLDNRVFSIWDNYRSFKIRKQFTDCLSRQVGEAVAILLSKDQLLNSKNEYVQNCISRITIQEDSLERKKRLIQEEVEEKKEETALAEFKAKKRADSKRKDEELIGNPSKRRKFSSLRENVKTYLTV